MSKTNKKEKQITHEVMVRLQNQSIAYSAYDIELKEYGIYFTSDEEDGYGRYHKQKYFIPYISLILIKYAK